MIGYGTSRMKKLPIVFILISLLVYSYVQADTVTGNIVRIIDGDTMVGFLKPTYGTQGNKIGNAHLKWAFSEAAVLYLRGNEKAQKYLLKLQKRMSKAKALSALAHKLGRCVYFMLKNETVFDERRFLKG